MSVVPRWVPRALVPALWVAALAAVAVNGAFWLSDLTYPGTNWREPGAMADFRDTIFGPGRFLLDGGNPYDPDRYLAVHPWAQEFDPYAPAWLLLSAALSVLPFALSAAAYLVLAVVLAVVMLRVLFVWAAPSLVAAGVPAGLLYLAVWSPGRYALENGGTLLVFLGWVLVMRTLVGPDPHTAAARGSSPADRTAVWTGAAGLALTLLKPQFGLPLVVVMLAAGHRAAVWRGLAVLAAASTPVVALCSISAGGFGAYLGSIARLVAYASSPAASTGLLSPFNGRTDLLGLAARFARYEAPGWASAAAAVAAALLAAIIGRRCANPVTATAGIAAASLLGLVHQPYDAVVLLVPAVLGLGRLVAHRPSTRLHLWIWMLALVPVLHLHRVSTLVIPGFTRAGAELLDAAALMLCLVGAVVVAAGRVGPRADRSTDPLPTSRT